MILPLDYGREMSEKRCAIHSCISQILVPFRVHHHDPFLVRFLQTVVIFEELNFYLVTVMRVLEIKLSRFARYKTKRACCNVLNDQWLWIVMSLVISIMGIKPVNFHSRTAGVRVALVWLCIEKLNILRAISVFGLSFLLLLGPPFTTCGVVQMGYWDFANGILAFSQNPPKG